MKKSRRNFSSAFKAEVALAAIQGLKTIAEIAQEFEIHPVQVSTWKKTFLENASGVFEGERKKDEELEKLKHEREELFKQQGELKFENNWYKKTQMLSNEDRCMLVDIKDNETSISQQCRMLEISRSRLYYSPT